MEINYFDIIVAAILVYAIISGAINGFVMELASSVMYILGGLGAFMIGGWAKSWLGHWVDWPHLGIIAYILVFLIIMALVYLLGNSVNKLLEKTPLNFLNRLLGALFCSIKYLFLLSIFLYILTYFNQKDKLFSPQKMENSYLFESIDKFIPSIIPYISIETTTEELLNIKQT